MRSISKYIVFQVGKEQYGLGIEKIHSIETIKPITCVPGSKYYFSGVSNYNGELTPIIDMRHLLGIEANQNSNSTKIIFVFECTKIVGLLVDEAKQVIDISEIQISLIENVVGHSNSTYLQGIANHEVGIIGIINSNEIVKISKELTV